MNNETTVSHIVYVAVGSISGLMGDEYIRWCTLDSADSGDVECLGV